MTAPPSLSTCPGHGAKDPYHCRLPCRVSTKDPWGSGEGWWVGVGGGGDGPQVYTWHRLAGLTILHHVLDPLTHGLFAQHRGRRQQRATYHWQEPSVTTRVPPGLNPGLAHNRCSAQVWRHTWIVATHVELDVTPGVWPHLGCLKVARECLHNFHYSVPSAVSVSRVTSQSVILQPFIQ